MITVKFTRLKFDFFPLDSIVIPSVLGERLKSCKEKFDFVDSRVFMKLINQSSEGMPFEGGVVCHVAKAGSIRF
ncbi:hypothetical protein D3C86_1949380 [compost metagenome]